MRPLLRLGPVVASVAILLLVVTTGAGSAPRAGTPEEAVAPACAELQQKLGPRFATIFGSTSGCVARLAGVVRAADVACATSASRQTCVEQKLQAEIQRLVAGGLPSAAELAQELCSRMQSDLGTQFTTRFGSFAGCVTETTPVATAALAGCAGATDKGACVKVAIDKGLESLKRTAPTAQELGVQIAAAACEQARQKLGARFDRQFPSQAACISKIRAAATELASTALSRCSSQPDVKACVTAAVTSEAAKLQKALGVSAAPTAAELADQIARTACEAARTKLGTAFTKQLGSIDACVARLQKSAGKVAQDALDACKGATDEEGCLRQAIETRAASLQFELGAGAEPSAAQIADEVAGEACTAAQARLGSRFKTQFGSLAACKQRILARARAITDDAVARCRSAYDRAACVREAIQTSAASLQFALGGDSGPTAATLAAQIADKACTDAYLALRSPRFEQKLGSLEACRAKVKSSALPLATAAISGCSNAPDKEACVRQRIESGAVSLRNGLGGGAPTAAEVADEVAGDACVWAQSRLGAPGFAKRFGSLAGCKGKVMPQALKLAQQGLSTCARASIPASCLRAAIESFATTIERALGLR